MSDLLRLVESGDLEAFEARCLEQLERDVMDLGPIARSFEHLEKSGQVSKAAAVGQMVIEHAAASADAQAALRVARVLLLSNPDSAELRNRVAALFQRAYSEHSACEAVLRGSGLLEGRPARVALRILEVAIGLQAGDTLVSRTDDAVAEVIEPVNPQGMIVLKRNNRPTIVPAAEAATRYERVPPDDFRVLRALRPERLREIIESDPVPIITAIVRSHGDLLDIDVLRDELVPAMVEPGNWSKWWTRTRTLLKKSPNLGVEGRSPVMLRWSAAATTAEGDAWQRMSARSDPGDWLEILDGYLREKRSAREVPDASLLQRVVDHVANYATSIRNRRPAEALACAILLDRLASEGAPSSGVTSVGLLREANNPEGMLSGLPDVWFWERGVASLVEAHPDRAGELCLKLMRVAPAGVMDLLASHAAHAGRLTELQALVDAALADPVRNPELMYWLWKGPDSISGLRLPSDDVLFAILLDALSALGRSLTPSAESMKLFRGRMRAALALRDFSRAREVIARADPARAVTLRQQLERLEGIGDVARSRLIDALRDAHPTLWAVRTRRVEPWQDENVLWTTQEGLRKKTEERDHLVNVTMRDNARRIGEAASYGDLSENSEYKFALEERDLLRARLAQMNAELSKARTLDSGEVPTDHVGVGSRVKLRGANGAERSIVFLGPFDADVDRGIFNYLAPMSQKLMGKTLGDKLTISLGAAEEEFEIVSIDNGLA